ncbi:MAG: hypothetical protein C3F15_00665 [Holophagae bacterium]|nr:MAG: hypothetical protein C3F15_00665 [Holophagae bacterium]
MTMSRLGRSEFLASMVVVAAVWCGFARPAAAQSIQRATAPIEVGPTVPVSGSFADREHNENLAVGDPSHPGRLITCSMVSSHDVGKICDQHCYVSFDGGATWAATLEVAEGSVNGDPTAVYGLGDDLYVVALVIKDLGKPKDPDPGAPEDDAKTVVYKSSDGGRTWKESSRFEFIDREFIAVDTTGGERSGRVYIAGQASIRGIDGSRVGPALKLFRSLDGGATFLGPVSAQYPIGTEIAGVGTAAVLSDGTFVVMFGLTKKDRQQNLEQEPTVGPNGELYVISSKDGGETFGAASKITDWKFDRQRSEGGMLGQLAADPGSEEFKDRLYAVYPAIVDDRIQIQFSFSADKGKTWSKPVVVNDDRSPEKGGEGPDHLLPSVAINADGVVLVTWYDRREAGDNLGWRLRAAASLDGGETFSASVPVTGVVNSYPQTIAWDLRGGAMNDATTSLVTLGVYLDPFFVSGGHTSGLAVDADGSFHPTWTDNRTGIAQLWTAPIRVGGTVAKHGAADLAALDDISKSVTLKLGEVRFDRAAGTLSMAARLKNISGDTVEGPAKVRVITLESAVGVAEITNADNGERGTGAVWDFSSQLPEGGLPSMQLSAPKQLTFQLTDLRGLRPGKKFEAGVLTLDTRVLGKLLKNEAPKTGEEKAPTTP